MDVVPLLAGVSSAQTGPAYDAGTPQASCSLTVITSGSPSFSVQLQGSANASTWSNTGSALTTATTSSLTPSPAARYFRAVLSGFTGPGAVTAKLSFTAGTGYTGAPSSGTGSASVQTASYGTSSQPLNAGTYGAFLVTLTGNPTFSFTGATAGTECSFTVYLKQDSTGGRTVTWPAVKWQDGIAPVLSTTAGAADILVFSSPDGTTWYGSQAGVNFI